ncbi:MAG: beta-lactamase family protein [Acidobacteria bacterium]|nr:beta-lactamase family protein [Acidobacteriota bacterium]
MFLIRRFVFGIVACGLCLGGIIFTQSLIRGNMPETSTEAAGLPSSELSEASPEEAGFSSSGLQNIEAAVEASIKDGELPGAVVLAARQGKIAYLKAFGNRAIKPGPEPMTTDTIFDIASMTKVVATTPAIMQLVDNGSLRLGDPVKRYLPKFTGGGKDDITVSQLLTHYSGLRPGFDPSREWFGHAAALEELWKEKVSGTPGKSFAYSDLNFIVLAELVRAVSGKALDVYAREHIFLPLGMTETAFQPPADWTARIAPTEMRQNAQQMMKGIKPAEYKMLRGEVHDITVWKMGGVSGQAGVFSSARDLAIYAQTLLNRGVFYNSEGGERLLSEASVAAMTSPQSPPQAANIRGYGWDINSEYSSPLGDLFSGGFGHTGFTGTSIWIHPPSDSFVIILSNRVHPSGGKNINHLRGVIANIVAASILD